jgi:ankyrin repeat protein
MAEFLIKKGARIEILSDGDQIPLTLCPPENTEIKKLLQTTLELDSYLHQAIKNQNIEEIRQLLDRGARPNGGITKEVEEQTASQSKIRKGKFVSNIRLAIESDSSDVIIGLLMNGYVKTTSNPLEIACSSDKENLFKYLCHEDYNIEKNIPNLLYKSIQHASVKMVKYLLNDYDINYKYENQFNNNALQVAISNQFHFKTDDEKVRGKEIINLLIDKIIEKYPQHEEVLSSKNTKGFDARFMLSHMGEIGKDLLDVINRKIEEEKQKEKGDKRRQSQNSLVAL